MSFNRRKFIASTAVSLAAGALGNTVLAATKSEKADENLAGSRLTDLPVGLGPLKQVKTIVLNIRYHESGPQDGKVVILLMEMMTGRQATK